MWRFDATNSVFEEVGDEDGEASQGTREKAVKHPFLRFGGGESQRWGL